MARSILAAALVSVAGAAGSASAQNIATELFKDGFSLPVYVTHAPGDYRRVFVVQQRGQIRIVDDINGARNLLALPFLNLTGVVSTSGFERGLLGLAFHPDYATNGRFYVSYTRQVSSGQHPSVIAEYEVSGDPNVALTAQTRQILQIAQTDSNHNGGWIGFGPDGFLYIALGDGGGAGDPFNAGQNTSTALGKMLRIDVDGADNIPGNADDDGFPADATRSYQVPATNPFAGAVPGLDEIWHLGLRNPWRCSFDRVTGDLYMADVGQNVWEEVNRQAAGDAGGRNYGWDCREGPAAFSGCLGSFVDPILSYDHGLGRCSITGGYVYRGCAIPSIVGDYFYGDYCGNQLYKVDVTNFPLPAPADVTTLLDPPGALSIGSITSFGEDAFGELYIVDQGGEVFKIVPRTAEVGDCDADTVPDACAIAAGFVEDANDNGLPDDCDCPGDANGDTTLDAFDFNTFVDLFNAGNLSIADANDDTTLDAFDFNAFVDAFNAGCP